MLREILNVALIYNLTWTKKTGTLSLMTVINNKIYFFSKTSLPSLCTRFHSSAFRIFFSLIRKNLPTTSSNNILSTISSRFQISRLFFNIYSRISNARDRFYINKICLKISFSKKNFFTSTSKYKSSHPYTRSESMR